MGKKRRQYTKEFKIEAVRLKVEEGRPIFEVARELGTAFIASLEKEICGRENRPFPRSRPFKP